MKWSHQEYARNTHDTPNSCICRSCDSTAGAHMPNDNYSEFNICPPPSKRKIQQCPIPVPAMQLVDRGNGPGED